MTTAVPSAALATIQPVFTEAERVALEYSGIMGEGNYYLEIQDQGMPEQKAINPLLVSLSRKTGAGCGGNSRSRMGPTGLPTRRSSVWPGSSGLPGCSIIARRVSANGTLGTGGGILRRVGWSRSCLGKALARAMTSPVGSMTRDEPKYDRSGAPPGSTPTRFTPAT